MAFSHPDHRNPTDDSPSVVQQQQPGYSLNGKIVMAALVVLFLIVLVILALHIYVKWYRSHSRRRQRWWRWRQERGLHPGEEQIRTLGLEKAVVESLPTFVYQVAPSRNDGLDCAVCLCEFQENEKGRLLPKCSHSFHTDCIDMWFLSHTTCPLCRTSAEPSVPASVGQGQDASAEMSSTFVLPPNARHGSDEIESDDGEGETVPPAEAEPSSQATPEQPLPSSGWHWRRSISDRFPHPQGVQFPTNVLFWGNHSHVSSRVSSPRLEHGQIGGRSLSHVVVEIPSSQDNFLTLRSASFSRLRASSTDDQSSPSPSEKQPFKFTAARLYAFTKLLGNRERKISPTVQSMDNSGEQSGASHSST